MTDPKGKRPNTAKLRIEEAMAKITEARGYKPLSPEALRKEAKDFVRLQKSGYYPV